MFLDNLASAELGHYPKAIAKALQWLRAQDATALSPGRHDIDGDTMYAQVIDVQTQDRDALKPERHRRYIDVQYLCHGEEGMGVAIESGNNPLAKAYDAAGDILFYETAENEIFFTLHAGQFTVFFPTDIHRSTIAVGAPQAIRKIVVKVAMDSL
ncbi:MAG: YhcH/YjgK/YiaL family protein [Cardiobacteriaceae bacterium]|nr:YhcH/YjgK/YiaL family protein [Cardiobacteriaceae bacterium]